RTHGHLVPLAGLVPALHVFGLWLAHPCAPVGFVEAASVFVGIDFRLESANATEPFFFDAEVKAAIPLHSFVFQPHGEVAVSVVSDKMAKLLFLLRVRGTNGAAGDFPFASADDVPTGESLAVPK